MKPSRRLTFEIPASPAAVDQLCGRVDSWLIEGDLAPERFPAAMLLRESLNNSMLHGCSEDSARLIRCEIRRGLKWLHIRVEDDGPGFDWTAQLECRPEITECHGRGLQIYRLYADGVHFNRRGNRLHLRRRIQGGQVHADSAGSEQ